MHERRNMALVVLLCLAVLWAAFAWVVAPDYAASIKPSLAFHQNAALGVSLVLVAAVVYVLKFQDKLGDDLAHVAGGRYYEQDGLCFMPLVRITKTKKGHQRAEISLYYQNRYRGMCEAVIHIRPSNRAFFSHHGARDIHFAFQARPGAFGVIHQPIAVGTEHQGEVIEVQIAAVVRFPKTRGQRLRSHEGMPVGTFQVDWALAYRQTEHELGGDIELIKPAVLHMTMPESVLHDIERGEYTKETIAHAG